MDNGILSVIIIVFFSYFFIYVVKNKEAISKKLENLKIKKFFSFFILLSFILFDIVFIGKNIKELNENINWSNNYINFDKYEKEIKKEREYYNSIIRDEYGNNYSNPYILNGFKYVEGEWNTGFVIEDENANQFVWIPVTNIEDSNAVELTKKDFIVNSNVCKEGCFDDRYKQFIKSIIENGGFYISRYETGIENNKIVSKSGINNLLNIHKKELEEKIKKMYDSTNFNCELINGYAYDTAIEWILKDYNPEIYYIDTDDNILTGRNSNKNIFDLFDNVFEYTRRKLL